MWFTIIIFNFLAQNWTNHGVIHHLDVIRNMCCLHTIPQWGGVHQVLPTFAGTIFTPWSSGAVIYTALHLYPPRDLRVETMRVETMTTWPPRLTLIKKKGGDNLPGHEKTNWKIVKTQSFTKGFIFLPMLKFPHNASTISLTLCVVPYMHSFWNSNYVV